MATAEQNQGPVPVLYDFSGVVSAVGEKLFPFVAVSLFICLRLLGLAALIFFCVALVKFALWNI